MEKHVSTYNNLVVAFGIIGSILVGYDQGIIGSTLGQVSWYNQLGLPMTSEEPGYDRTITIESASNGVYFASCVFGALAIGAVMNRFGRIRAFQFSIFWQILGSVLLTASMNQPMFLVARVVIGFATGNNASLGPTYLAEVSPPHARGFMTGLHATAINAGYMLGAWIGFGCSFASPTTTFGFRFPLAVPILLSFILLAATFWIPESPRWLVTKDRGEEALPILERLHRDRGEPNNNFARLELDEIEKQVAIDNRVLGNRSAWMAILMDRKQQWRLLIAVLVCAGSMNTGILVINNYAVSIYTSLGVSTTISLLLSAVWLTLATIYGYLGAAFSDRIGRRKFLLIGYTCNIIVLILYTAMYAKFQETGLAPYAKASIAFIFLYELTFGFGIDPHCFCVMSEVFPSYMRATGNAITYAILYLYNVVWTQAAPTAFANIGYKFYLVFIIFGILQTLAIYFILPETGGVPLEEIDELFGGEVAMHLADSKLPPLLTENNQGKDAPEEKVENIA